MGNSKSTILHMKVDNIYEFEFQKNINADAAIAEDKYGRHYIKCYYLNKDVTNIIRLYSKSIHKLVLGLYYSTCPLTKEEIYDFINILKNLHALDDLDIGCVNKSIFNNEKYTDLYKAFKDLEISRYMLDVISDYNFENVVIKGGTFDIIRLVNKFKCKNTKIKKLEIIYFWYNTIELLRFNKLFNYCDTLKELTLSYVTGKKEFTLYRGFDIKKIDTRSIDCTFIF